MFIAALFIMSLLLKILSRLVVTFLPRSKRLLISWLQSPSVVILEPKKIKSVTVSTFPHSVCYEVMGPDAMILVDCKYLGFSLTGYCLGLGRASKAIVK